MKLKTLKDIGQSKRDCCSIEKDYLNICEKCLKQEAIKWAKEDRQLDVWDFNNVGILFDFIEERWMKRLNITEEDLHKT